MKSLFNVNKEIGNGVNYIVKIIPIIYDKRKKKLFEVFIDSAAVMVYECAFPSHRSDIGGYEILRVWRKQEF